MTEQNADVSGFSNFESLPQLAGMCGLEQAMQCDWSVARSVAWQKRLHFVARKLCEFFAESIPSQPVYELKMLFSHHAYLLSEQVAAIRKRVSEMRQPPLGLEVVPHPLLAQVFDELRDAPDEAFKTIAAYEVVLGWLMSQYKELQQAAHPLADAPTVRLAKLSGFELDEVCELGRQTTRALRKELKNAEQLDSWLNVLAKCLTIASKESSAQEQSDEPERAASTKAGVDWPDRHYSRTRRKQDFTPRRDVRFRDPYNAGVNAEAFLYDPAFSSRDKTLMMYYKRLREIDVPEVMSSILHDLKHDEPWGFYQAMVRQLWDEARHAMMGEVGFMSQGLDWTSIPVNFTWSLNLNSQLNARERHGVLFFIEQGLMPKSGKRFEWEVGLESGDELAALFQDFDWADEVLHAQIGQRWYVPNYDSLQQALDYGDKAWSKVMSHWEEYRENGLTQHRNWWPDLYREFCRQREVHPAPETLAFDVDYHEQRADLKKIEP